LALRTGDRDFPDAPLKLADLFDCIITGDQCARCKPDPEPFARGLAALGVAAGEAAGVGDTVHDLQSARRGRSVGGSVLGNV
jgi:phosphoglycolate phosphatase